MSGRDRPVPLSRSNSKNAPATRAAYDDRSVKSVSDDGDVVVKANPHALALTTPAIVSLSRLFALISKHTGILRIIVISRSFHNWHKICFTPEATEKDGHREKKESTYIAHLAENEKLREQIHDMRRTMGSKEASIRSSSTCAIISMWYGSRLRKNQRKFFDRWVNNIHRMKTKLAFQQQAMDYEVGLQHVDSNITYLEETEQKNLKLQKTLLCMSSFIHWKIKASFATLTEERKIFETQRRQIWYEISALRESVIASNKQETALLSTALRRGRDVSQSLESLKGNLGKALKMHKALERQSEASVSVGIGQDEYSINSATATSTSNATMASSSAVLPGSNAKKKDKVDKSEKPSSSVSSRSATGVGAAAASASSKSKVSAH